MEVLNRELVNSEGRFFELRLPDGRILAGAEFGDPKGRPVVLMHGAPGSCERPVPPNSKLKGVRLITVDRSGYRNSSRNEGRTVADFVHDVKYLLDEFGIEKCDTMGRSGGAIYALGLAALYPEIITGVVVSGAFAPQKSIEGMTDSNKLLYASVGEGKEKLTDEEKRVIKKEVYRIASVAYNQTDRLRDFPPNLRPQDLEDIRAVPGLEQDLIASYKDGLRSDKKGFDGMVDDAIALQTPWGFDLSMIKAPVIVHQAKDDQYVPKQNGIDLVKYIPGAKLMLTEGTHFRFYSMVSEFLRWMVRSKRILPWAISENIIKLRARRSLLR